MKKSVLAKLKSKENFLTSYRESDELFDYLKQKQDEFDNGGIFVEICDNETMMNTDVNVSKIVACIRKYTIEGDVNKDLDVYLILEVDILDTPRGRKLVNNDSSLFVLFDSVHKKFLIVDSDDYLSGEFTSTAKEDFRGFPFFIVGLLTKQKEVSDKITEEYTDDDLLKFLLRQIKAIGVDAKEFDTDEIVDATIIYKNRSETDCRLPRKLIDYLSDRINDLFYKHDRLIIDEQLKEKNRMKKYTDTELLEKLLPKLNYSTIISELKDGVDIIVNESFYKDVEKDFAVALQNRINELRKKVRVEATNIAVDKAEDMCEDACEDTDMKCISIDEEGVEHTNRRWGDCTERTYSSREYYELKKEIVEKDHEIWKLKRTVEALEDLIYNCISKDDRRKY